MVYGTRMSIEYKVFEVHWFNAVRDSHASEKEYICLIEI